MITLLMVMPLFLVFVLNLPFAGVMRRLSLPAVLAFCLFEAMATLLGGGSFLFLPLPVLDVLWVSLPDADDLSRVMFLSIAIVGATALCIGRSAISEVKRRFNFENLLLLSIAGMNGIVAANDLFNLYVFLEVAAVASFVMIALDREKDAYEGAFKYIVLSSLASALMLSAVALLFIVSGGVSFGEVALALGSGGGGRGLALVAIAIFIAGLSIKSGIMPFHGWLPDAYSAAPAPASVLLAGIVTKTTGVYAFIRLVTFVFGYSEAIKSILIVFALVSIIAGALAALGQKDFKRLLSYSSISQVGYIILGLGVGTPLAIAGAIFHIFNHAVFKSLLFVNAWAVEKSIGTRDTTRMGGLSKKMPVTGASSVVAFLSAAGVPPLAGFWSKLVIVLAAWKAGYHVSSALAVLAGLLTLGYFLVLQRRVFFGKLSAGLEGVKEAGALVQVPSIILALIILITGLLVPWLFGTFILPIGGIL